MTALLEAMDVHFDILPLIAVLLVAYVLALPIASDRERNERRAGLRTFPLVAIAPAVSSRLQRRSRAEALKARIVEGIIKGVGFIGGRAILVGKASIRGTATAASLWATGAIGVAVGLGPLDIALVLSIATFGTLRFMTNFKSEGNEHGNVDP